MIKPFRDAHWDSFLDLSGPVHDDLVREFYAGFSYDDTQPGKNITFYVQSKCYKVTLSTFGLLLGIPTEGFRFYKAGHELTNLPEEISKEAVLGCITNNPNLKTNFLVTSHLAYPHDKRYKIVDHNIMCRDGNLSQVPASVAALLVCLENNLPVNLAYFVAKRMSGIQSKSPLWNAS